MKSEAFIQPQIIRDLNNQFVPVQINAREQRALADQFQVRVYPTIAVVRDNGGMIETWSGYRGLADFQSHMSSVKAKGNTTMLSSSRRQQQQQQQCPKKTSRLLLSQRQSLAHEIISFHHATDSDHLLESSSDKLSP